MKDFVPIAMVCDTNYSVFVKGDSPIKTFEDLIARAKKSAKSVSIGCALKSDVHLNIEIFQKAMNWASVEPKKILFIDDIKGHVDVAVSLGMQGIHFVSAHQLKKELYIKLNSAKGINHF